MDRTVALSVLKKLYSKLTDRDMPENVTDAFIRFPREQIGMQLSQILGDADAEGFKPTKDSMIDAIANTNNNGRTLGLKYYNRGFNIKMDVHCRHDGYVFDSESPHNGESLYFSQYRGSRQLLLRDKDSPEHLIYHCVDFQQMSEYLREDTDITLSLDDFGFYLIHDPDGEVEARLKLYCGIKVLNDSGSDLHTIGDTLRELMSTEDIPYTDIVAHYVTEMENSGQRQGLLTHPGIAAMEMAKASQYADVSLPHAFTSIAHKVDYLIDLQNFTRSRLVITDIKGYQYDIAYADEGYGNLDLQWPDNRTPPLRLFHYFIKQAMNTGESLGTMELSPLLDEAKPITLTGKPHA